MLGKLMKHEFRATGRIGLPLCGVMLVLSIVAGMVMRFESSRQFYHNAGSVIILLYGLSIFAVAIGIFVVLMQHFKRNLLGDEGYLMRTLPVSTHELLLSKLFTALLWYLVAAVLIGLSGLLVVLLSGEVAPDEWGGLWSAIRQTLAKRDGILWFASVAGGIGGMALFTLLFYADFTLSQTFSKHKVLYNIAGVVIFIVLLRLLFSLNGFLDTMLFDRLRESAATAQGAAGSVGIIGGADGPTAIYVVKHDYGIGLIELYLGNVALYFLTWAFLKFKPNIE